MQKDRLISLLSAVEGISPAAAELFAEQLSDAVTEGLRHDGVVKIKGLGTLKVVEVKARKSVNINNGESYEIPAHRKVTFTADARLAEAANQPLAHLEPYELPDEPGDNSETNSPAVNSTETNSTAVKPLPEPESETLPRPSANRQDNLPVDDQERGGLKKLNDDADALMDLLSAINGPIAAAAPVAQPAEPLHSGQTSEPAPIAQEPVTASPSADDNAIPGRENETRPEPAEAPLDDKTQAAEARLSAEETPIIDAPLPAEEQTPASTAAQAVETSVKREETAFPASAEESATDAYEDYLEAKRRHKKHVTTTVLLVVALVVLLAGGGLSWYMFRGQKARSAEPETAANELVETPKTATAAPVEPALEALPESEIAPETETEQPANVKQTPVSSNAGVATSFERLKQSPRDYKDILKVVTVEEGTRLTMLALEAYGHKAFWVYIFEANRDQLSDPNRVRAGMRIRIPRMDARLVDPDDPRCIECANELQSRYVK